MFPLRDHNPTRVTPLVTRSLIAINLAVFVFELSLGPRLRGFYGAFALVPGQLTNAAHGGAPLAPVALTLLTSMFLHGGWTHVIGNMWYLWIFGDNIEDRFGHARFLLFYVVAGAFAGVLHTLTNPASSLPTVGASGAIAGVLGAYAAAFPRTRVSTLLPLFPFFQVVELPALLVLGFWFLMQFASGTLALAAGLSGGVAWWAHIGGFAFGFAVLRAAGRGTLFRPARMV
ncbi:MAG: rhomboid family intramembrane serine protease [Candidatus Eisenbacteria bacterium]|nr:rhomboid family intramembrane serine protease [Candidatus Eisenbacteria bacterium]